ncbi:MAG TPA: hypothetical protein DCY07_03295 [Rhodospirillaceae bacterium]|nr:hypothetical protein [Rhodospirillaceae bacterium]
MKTTRRDFLTKFLPLAAASVCIPDVLVKAAEQVAPNVFREGNLEATIYKSVDPKGDTIIAAIDYGRQIGGFPNKYTVTFNAHQRRVSIDTFFEAGQTVYPLYAEFGYNPETGTPTLRDTDAKTPRGDKIIFSKDSPEIKWAECDIAKALNIAFSVTPSLGMSRPEYLPTGEELSGVTSRDRETQVQSSDRETVVMTRFYHPSLPGGQFAHAITLGNGITTIKRLAEDIQKTLSKGRPAFRSLNFEERLFFAKSIAVAMLWDAHKVTSGGGVPGPQNDGWFKLYEKPVVRAPHDMIVDPDRRDLQGAHYLTEATINDNLHTAFSSLRHMKPTRSGPSDSNGWNIKP